MIPSSQPCIGIIGGMGPAATVRFEQKLVDAFSGNDQMRPDIITMNIGRIPDRTNYLLGIGPDPVPLLTTIAQRCVQAGASVLVMPCNSAHAPKILHRVLPSVGVPFLRMPQLTLQHITERKLKRVMILATDGTLQAGTFDSPATIYPQKEVQKVVMRCIRTIKLGDLPPSSDLCIIKDALNSANADGVVLGCTELSFLGKVLQKSNRVVIDTLDVLVEACVQYIAEGK